MDIDDLNSASIHLDENWQAKIQLITPCVLYIKYNIEMVDPGPRRRWDDALSEIYAFGEILFELLCGRLAVTDDEQGGTKLFNELARSHYENGTLTDIIDPLLRVQMNRDAIAIYSEVAYRCLNEDPSICPTISVVTTSESPQTSTRL
nr:protein kinase-like domain-containing protein [Tanacetum cinerariifolium]